MEQLSIAQIIENIQNETLFEAIAEDYSFTLKIESYQPYVCSAIHDGHQFRSELWDNCLHTEYDRWYEEDPATKEMIHSHPIVIAGCDSRFEYDLNRAPENAVFENAWGKKLWKKPLPNHQKEKSLEKHTNFYKVVDALIKKLESKHEVVVVYDIHSYNWRRWNREVPVINLGTSNIDNERFGDFVEHWRKTLSELYLPHVAETTSKVNDTFFGKGYFLKYITENFKNTLVLATEFKKIYCDELNQIIYPEVVDAIEKQLQKKIKESTELFQKKHKPI